MPYRDNGRAGLGNNGPIRSSFKRKLAGKGKNMRKRPIGITGRRDLVRTGQSEGQEGGPWQEWTNHEAAKAGLDSKEPIRRIGGQKGDYEGGTWQKATYRSKGKAGLCKQVAYQEVRRADVDSKEPIRREERRDLAEMGLSR